MALGYHHWQPDTRLSKVCYQVVRDPRKDAQTENPAFIAALSFFSIIVRLSLPRNRMIDIAAPICTMTNVVNGMIYSDASLRHIDKKKLVQIANQV